VIDGFPAIGSTFVSDFRHASWEGFVEDRLARLESQLAYLAERVVGLEQRVGLLEDRRSAVKPVAPEEPGVAVTGDIGRIRVQQLLALAGRTLVVLGGAYLLRALTELGVLTTPAGVALGILYGAPWLLLASRAAARGAQLDASVHALTAALIGYPLVWEATLRFNVVSPAQSAALLGALTAGAFVLSSVRALQGLAWITMIGTQISSVGLAIGTGDWIAYTVLAIVVGIATLWLGYIRDWTMLRWPAAVIGNAMLLILTARSAVDGHISAALLVQMLMLGGYLGSFAIRTLLIGRPVIPFEVVQSLAVLVIAYGGAISLIRSSSSNILAVGIASLVLAAGGYVVAFSFVDRRRHVRNFFFYAQLAQLFALVGIILCAGGGAGSVVYSAGAVTAAMLARHTGRLALSLQASIYAIGAALASGLLEHALLAMWSNSLGFAVIPRTATVALAALAIVTFVPIRNTSEPSTIFASVLRCVLIAVLAWTAAGISIALVIGAMPGGEHTSSSVLATIRTGALVIGTLGLALATRHPSGREAAWLVYPLLFLTGAKLLLVDFPQGHPQTLFAALALYGIALSAVPRLLRRVSFRAMEIHVVAPAHEKQHADQCQRT
jgi:hypothetical protein